MRAPCGHAAPGRHFSLARVFLNHKSYVVAWLLCIGLAVSGARQAARDDQAFPFQLAHANYYNLRKWGIQSSPVDLKDLNFWLGSLAFSFQTLERRTVMHPHPLKMELGKGVTSGIPFVV